MFLPQEVIRKKRDGKVLSLPEIQCFVDGLVSGRFNDAQVGSMAMAIYQHGMSTEEIVEFTRAMMNSGQVLAWDGVNGLKVDGPIVDKHSSGGVGDKVSFMLAAIVAACGAYVPMISGRGLGHTGGTSDKLEAIAGFNIHPSIEKFQSIVKELGVAIISQTDNLAPADKRLYGIRDVTSTVESVPLITASILSKKLASGLDALVMDVKMGNGAVMHDLEEARTLANSIVNVANGAGVKTQAIITDMNEVLGASAGNAIEMIETADYLTGKYREPRLHAVVVALAKAMLINTKLATSDEDAGQKIDAVLANGKAAEIFDKMIAALGGPTNFLENPWGSMEKAPVVKDILAPQSGYISAVDTREVGLAIVAMKGGRTANGELIDHRVGFDAIVAKGTKVEQGDIIARVHAVSDEQAAIAIDHYLQATQIAEAAPELSPIIYDTIG